MSVVPEISRPLVEYKANKAFFVGIDSDGCAFDSMEIKHKECFCPEIIKHWGLQAVSKYAREAAEFVNLYSKWRGVNRWPALVMVLDLLRERAEVQTRGARIPQAQRVREFIASGSALSDSGLKQYLSAHPDPELEQALGWTTAVNQSIAEMVHGVPPFPFVEQSLKMMTAEADLMVVSATPTEALAREWKEHGIARYVRLICGQEMGKKEDHLALAAKDNYLAGHVLMIGDAPGDFKAARSIGALFFPINPGEEEQSWERFYREGYARFLGGTYAGAYEAGLIDNFEKRLPDTPPWKK